VVLLTKHVHVHGALVTVIMLLVMHDQNDKNIGRFTRYCYLWCIYNVSMSWSSI